MGYVDVGQGEALVLIASPPMFGHIIGALAAAIPNAQRVTIADATRTMNVIKPAACNEAVLRFLQG